jgi:hypothetical protein
VCYATPKRISITSFLTKCYDEQDNTNKRRARFFSAQIIDPRAAGRYTAGFMPKSVKITRKKQSKRAPSKVARVRAQKPFRTYEKAIKYLFGRTDYEKETRLSYNVTTFNLKRMEKLLSLVGSPHQKVATAHIAGTKGKGSTAAMLAKMLEANGYTVARAHYCQFSDDWPVRNALTAEPRLCPRGEDGKD